MCNSPGGTWGPPLARPAPKETCVGALRKVCCPSLKIGAPRSPVSGIKALTRPQESQLYQVQASSRPSHRVVRDFPAWLLELGKGRRKWGGRMWWRGCAAWRARAHSKNPPRDSVNGANQFKKTKPKKKHRSTKPPKNSWLESPSVETGIWDRSCGGGQLTGFRVF